MNGQSHVTTEVEFNLTAAIRSDHQISYIIYVAAWPTSQPYEGSEYNNSGFPKLWVATQKWVAKLCRVGRQSFSGNIYFLSFICKLDKNTVFLLPKFSEFSIELQTDKAHELFDITW